MPQTKFKSHFDHNFFFMKAVNIIAAKS